MKQNDNRKVGRPKLADTNLKKKSLIISGICLLIVIALALTGIKVLNIKPSKLKGSIPIYKTYEVGDKFCLNGEEECFYTIEDNGNSVTALAEYNLNTSTNRQSQDYTTFSTDDNYWRDENYNLKSKYGTDIPAFVYDENSKFWEPLQNYQKYLNNTLGKLNISLTLLSDEQALLLKQNISTIFYSTNYFLGSADTGYEFGVWGENYGSSGSNGCSYTTSCGLRPVITIAKSDFAEIIGYEEEPEPVTTEEETTTTDEIITTEENTTTKQNITTTITNVVTTTNKVVTTKKKMPVINRKVMPTTTTEEETTTTTNVIVNKIVDNKTTTKQIVGEKNNKNNIPYMLGGIGIILLISIGFIIYNKNKNNN